MTNEEIKVMVTTLISEMTEYLDFFEDDNSTDIYSPEDINKCEAIINTYLSYLFTEKRTNEEIIAQVEITVKELNALNEKCKYSLIETEQREQLCTIIIEAARLCNYQFPDDEDITFEWRNW